MRKTNQIAQSAQKVFPDLSLSPAQLDSLVLYLELLDQWSQRYNLTSVKGFENQVSKHLLDALAPLGLGLGPLLQGRGMDLGSGAGLPGLILALCLPKVEFLSIEGVLKKVNFQETARTRMGLKNFVARQVRLEDLAKEPGLAETQDFVLARALSSLAELGHWGQVFLRPGGRLWAWKGQNWEEEWQALQAKGGWSLERALPYQLELGFGGVLLVLQKDPGGLSQT